MRKSVILKKIVMVRGVLARKRVIHINIFLTKNKKIN